MNKTFRFLLTSLLVFTLACQGSKHDEGGGGDQPAGDGFLTTCGIVNDGMLKNPIAHEEGMRVTVTIIGSNLAVATPQKGGQILVKIQGLSTVSDYYEQMAINTLKKIAGNGEAYFFPAEEDCTVTVTGGGIATVGSLVTLDGKSYAEELAKSGFSNVTKYDSCKGNLIGACLYDLEENGVQVEGVVSDFLWKPASDKDGKLVVLLNPSGATINVNGEILVDSGPGNGRGTQGRGSKPGCAYGANVRVRVTGRKGGIILFPNGSEEYIIPDGCKRVEFN